MHRLAFSLAVITASAVCHGQDLTPSQTVFKPSPVPDRVLLSWSDDPATTQSVSWRTDESVTKAKAELALASHGPELRIEPKVIEATTSPLETNLGKAYYHTVTFEGLEPRTQYAYRVGDGTNWSEWFQFRTASDQPAPVQFVYVGDAQNDIKSMWSRLIRQAFVDAPKATFLLHAGDLINRGDADHEWGEWFHSLGWMSGTIPQIAVPGNHEYSKVAENAERGLTAHWRPQFELPKNGPMGLEESVYYLDIQGVRLVALNSNEEQEIQTAWLEEVLSKNPNRWTIVTHHHPIHSSGKGRDNEHLRRAWQPLYDKYKVDLVLQGHDHTYGRTPPISFDPNEEQVAKTDDKGAAGGNGEAVRNVPTGVRGRTPGGTVYVVSVSGPKMYDLKEYPEGKDPFNRRAANTQLYQIISIDADRLRYEARTAKGDLYDAFTLEKRDGEANRFKESVPEEMEARLSKE